MNHRFLVFTLLAAGILVFGYGTSVPAQLDPTLAVHLEAAVLARQTSVEFAQRMAEYQQAAQAKQVAIAAIPEVRAIDAELAQLHQRIRELMSARDQAITRHAAVIEPLRREVRRREQELLAADPVYQALDHPAGSDTPIVDLTTP
jgi:hypothetical protein